MAFFAKTRILPPPLGIGDTIGVVAPSGPFDRKLFDAGLAVIHDMGFNTKVDDGVYQGQGGYLAGDDHHRAAQFNAMVNDGQVQAVLCARGGYGSLRILDRLDYDALATHPKAVIGFSDITALHRAIFLRTGLVTFHGPMVTTLARSDGPTLHSWGNTLTGRCDLNPALAKTRILNDGAAEGVLAGGNLATLCHLVGTVYGVDFSGAVLLIEEVGEAAYRIDRMLTQMKMAGVFNGLKAVLLGTFEDCGPVGEIDALIKEQFHDLDIPILSGAPIGHGKENLTVPLGVKVRLDTHGPELRLVDSVFGDRGSKPV
jgi:muramoyltetrapeptide carboxypeptidase